MNKSNKDKMGEGSFPSRLNGIGYFEVPRLRVACLHIWGMWGYFVVTLGVGHREMIPPP